MKLFAAIKPDGRLSKIFSTDEDLVSRNLAADEYAVECAGISNVQEHQARLITILASRRLRYDPATNSLSLIPED